MPISRTVGAPRTLESLSHGRLEVLDFRETLDRVSGRRGEPVLPTEIRSSTFGIRGYNVGDRQEPKGDWDGGANQKTSDVHDVRDDPWMNVDLTAAGPPGGWDPFLPGERTYWTLPTLGDPAEPTSAL